MSEQRPLVSYCKYCGDDFHSFFSDAPRPPLTCLMCLKGNERKIIIRQNKSAKACDHYRKTYKRGRLTE